MFINNEFEAYFYGWIIVSKSKDKFTDICSNYKEDNYMIKYFRNEIDKDIELIDNNSLLEFKFESSFPLQYNQKNKFTWSFIRGVFDGSNSDIIDDYCCIYIKSSSLKEFISDYSNISNIMNEDYIKFVGTNSLDFLSKIYDYSDDCLRLDRNYKLYLNQLKQDNVPMCNFITTTSECVKPSKLNSSDEGYDLHIIKIDKVLSENTIRYDTGICIQPDLGWHVEILPRSSLSNYGLILTNCVGLIDSSYRGTIKVTLTKIDKSLDNIVLPFKAVQIVLRKNVHFIVQRKREMYVTQRNEGGFGSTN